MLRAERVGNEVRLTWNTPDKTSDGLLNTAPITAVICREQVPVLRRSAVSTPCTQILRLPVQPGLSRATDTLPPALQQDPPRLLAYRIELFNPRDRSAGVSPQLLAAAGAAPPPPGLLTATATRKGTVIEWTASTSASPSVMQLTRSPPSNANTLAVHTKEKKPVGLPTLSKTDPSSPVVLQAPIASDSGGMLDSGILPGIPYIYIAQRIRTVSLGGSTFELRSEESRPITFAYRDVFPPEPPSGLQSIPGALLSAHASIDLSWDASPDTGISGYNVYRSDSKSAPFTRLNPALISGVSFRDFTVQPNHSYRYRVTALDPSGNESAPCQEIMETIQTP